MREILFRGKCTDTGRWYEGQYIHLHETTFCFKEDYESHPDNDIHQIVFERMTDWSLPNEHRRADVIPETVGQFTGLLDKNGKKIFEGDIIRVTSSDDMGFEIIGKVELMDGCYRVYYCIHHDFGRVEWIIPRIGGITEKYTYEIIGNIHDNPELLKGE